MPIAVTLAVTLAVTIAVTIAVTGRVVSPVRSPAPRAERELSERLCEHVERSIIVVIAYGNRRAQVEHDLGARECIEHTRV